MFSLFHLVNVDAFLVHENDKTKTDVLLHFVDYRDNSGMLEQEIVIQLRFS